MALKGAVIGCTNIIPGVSGGTVAVSFQVFDLMILSINGVISDKGKRMWHFLNVLPLLIGVLIGLVLFARLVSFLFANYPLPTFAAFLGMVLGSLPMLARNALKDGFKPISILWFALAFGLVLLMQLWQSGAAVTKGAYGPLQAVLLLLSMMLAAASMVMPGLSGSFVMLLLGQYQLAIDALAGFEWAKLIPMALGSVLGLALVAKLMGWLLKNRYASTYAAIMGFVCGSVVAMCMTLCGYAQGAQAWQLVLALAALLGGAALVLLSGRRAGGGAVSAAEEETGR